MRWSIIYLLLCLVFPLQAQATDEKPDENSMTSHEENEESIISDEDKELIADLELIELLELLENLSTLVSMEDTE